MKTILFSAILVATSIGVSAMDYGIDRRGEHSAQAALTRSAVLAEYERAKAAGEVPITESQMRQAERRELHALQAQSTLTRKQVRQELVVFKDKDYFDIHGH